MQGHARRSLDQQLITMHTFHTLQRRRRRPKYADCFGSYAFQKLSDLAGVPRCNLFVRVADQDSSEGGVRRIEHGFAVTGFPREKIFEALRASQLKGIVIRKITLNDDFSGPVAASGTSGYLSQ